MHTVPSICPFTNCGKGVDIVDEGSRRDSVSSQTSGTSTLVDEFTCNIGINFSGSTSQGLDENEETEHQHKPAEESSDSANKKRVNEDTDKLTEKSSSKKAKKVIKEEDSIVLKRLIRELFSDTTRISGIREKKRLHRESVRKVEDSRIFFDLYLKISKAEEHNANARHEVLRNYYYFGEEIEKRLTDYKQNMEEHEAQKVNGEVRDKLPKEVTKHALRKKTERARKVYDLFFRITDDKIQRMFYPTNKNVYSTIYFKFKFG
ncbi:hypothetical protein Glove_138g4 [Diversispora epigaea]|uniref:Uncharacterized protein n=1 Tax=Diversispora epigaea TaxID=1348612 RepID=A0A397J2H5_9GLOM|nr:hypothetical protein Glove_138g4 [Diversispora epigaea]